MKRFRDFLIEKRIAHASTSLQALYRELNQHLFNGELENVPVAFGKSPKGSAGITRSRAQVLRGVPRWAGGMKTIPGSITVTINAYDYEEEVLRGILAHEMVHVWTAQNNKHDTNQHGMYFLSKLREIQAKAPFKIPVSHESETAEFGPAKDVVFIAGSRSGMRYLCLYTSNVLSASDTVSNAQKQLDTLTKHNRFDWAACGVAKTSLAGVYPIRRELKTLVKGGYTVKTFTDLNVQKLIAVNGTPAFQ